MPDLPATAHAVLGLVAVHPDQTAHELAAFAGRSVGQFFPVTRSHVFTELARLAREGLVDADDAGGRRTHRITAAGTGELDRWLADAEVAPDRLRSPFLLRLFFADRLGPDQVAALLDEFEAVTVARRDALAVTVAKLTDPASAFRRATALAGLRQLDAQLAWAAEVRPTLAPPTTISTTSRRGS